MKVRCVALLCGALFVAAAALAQADEVDDLLSGKAVATQQNTSPVNQSAVPSLQDRMVEPGTFADEAAWAVVIDDDPRGQLSGDSAVRPGDRRTAPAAGVNLVPEPSAVALAALALLYFLIFFRRRHLA